MMSLGNRKNIISQSNQLTEARYTLTITEQRLVIVLLSLISPIDEEFKDYEIKISEFKKFLNINSNAIYKQTKDVLNKMAKRVLYIPTEHGYLVTHWFSSAEYNSKKGSIQISLDKKLKPYLLQLKEQFTKYKLFIVTEFKSFYTLRIYMLLKQYQAIGYREIDVIELRHILDIDDHKYRLFKDFRKWVLNKAKKELEMKNKKTNDYISDISFDLETIRTGRRITRLRFIIKKQAHNNEFSMALPQVESFKTTPALEALVKHKIKGKKAQYYIETQSEEEILCCVELFEEQKREGKVRSSGSGLLISFLDNRLGQETEAEKAIRNQAKIPNIPNIQDGTQLQAWAIANGLPAAPIGYDTYQYRQMLCNIVEKMRIAQEREK